MSTASGQSPDLSRIVSLIMQNPELIRQIEDLAKQDKEIPETEQNLQPLQKEETESVPTVALPMQDSKREKRTRLLSALRPYVSEKRSKTLDTLIGAMDLFDIIGRG